MILFSQVFQVFRYIPEERKIRLLITDRKNRKTNENLQKEQRYT